MLFIGMLFGIFLFCWKLYKGEFSVISLFAICPKIGDHWNLNYSGNFKTGNT